MTEGRIYESREVARILGVPAGQVAKWKHQHRVTPVRYARRKGHHVPLWELEDFIGPNWTGKAEGRSLLREYADNTLGRKSRNA